MYHPHMRRAKTRVEAAARELAGAEAGDGRDETNRSLAERLADAQQAQARLIFILIEFNRKIIKLLRILLQTHRLCIRAILPSCRPPGRCCRMHGHSTTSLAGAPAASFCCLMTPETLDPKPSTQIPDTLHSRQQGACHHKTPAAVHSC